MFEGLLFVIWFFLPAGAANVAPILVAPLPGIKRLDSPMDGDITFRGKRLLGPHKTWRGLISGIIAAVLVLWLQQALVANVGWVQSFTSQVDYAALPVVLLGILFGLGALLGDAAESFFKRQRGTPSGQKWFPFDQLDYIVGASLMTLPIVALHFWQYTFAVVFWAAVSLGASYIGYLLHLKKQPN